MLAGLDKPSEGFVKWAGQDINQLDDATLGHLRNRHLGFVYQFHHLLAEFTALENVAMPLWIQGVRKKEAKLKAQSMLEKVGLAKRATHKPAELSGGERQRVAIARALVNQPQCVLMDEPTGNLDAQTASQITDLLRQLNEDLGTAMVVVTHDLVLAGRMQQQLHMQDGRLDYS